MTPDATANLPRDGADLAPFQSRLAELIATGRRWLTVGTLPLGEVVQWDRKSRETLAERFAADHVVRQELRHAERWLQPEWGPDGMTIAPTEVDLQRRSRSFLNAACLALERALDAPPSPAASGVPLTAPQQRVLQVAYDAFWQHSRWPPIGYVDRVLDREGSDLVCVLAEMPDGLVTHPQLSGPDLPEGILAVTLRGLTACANAEPDLQLFLCVLRFSIEREHQVQPATSTRSRRAWISSGDMISACSEIPKAKAVGSSRRVLALLRSLPNVWVEDQLSRWSGYWRTSWALMKMTRKRSWHRRWELTPGRGIRAYRGIVTLDDFFQAEERAAAGRASVVKTRETDYATLLSMVIGEAREQLDAQLATIDAQNLKSLGIVAANFAGIGLVIATHNALNRYWPATVVGLVVSVVFLILSAINRKVKSGPDLRQFYQKHVADSSAAMRFAMYEALLASIGMNDQIVTGWKRNFFWVGLIALGITAIGSLVYLPVVH
ncbi:MAG TPA: hypothetical protein VMW47_01745 [Verrucomicrobiae bacterium]|nr:hypothetical protein [Verrucomicrobiae bacterium]